MLEIKKSFMSKYRLEDLIVREIRGPNDEILLGIKLHIANQPVSRSFSA